MKLYYAQYGCSISPHIVLETIGKPFELVEVKVREGGAKTEEFLNMNPKGKTPVLMTDDGTVVTENPIICQYLAETNPEAELMPADINGKFAALQICAYFGDAIHNFALTRLFRPSFFIGGDEYWDGQEHWERIRAEGARIMRKGFDLIAPRLDHSDFLCGDFSIADAVVFYSEMHAFALQLPFPPSVLAHYKRMLALPAVQRVVAREGLDMTKFLPANS